MRKIVLDAREYKTSSGRYVERLLHYLQELDYDNEYSVLLKPQAMSSWTPTKTNFQKIACPHKEFTFAEQFGLKRQLKGLKPDLVHFPMVQQPIWYRGKTVTTMNDLTTLRFHNPSKNPIIFRLKQRIYALVNHRVTRKASAIITYTQYVKDDIVDYTGIDPNKVNVIYLAADIIKNQAVPIIELKDQQFLMYVGRPMVHKNLERLIEAFGKLKNQHPDLKLALAGKKDANYKKIAKLVDEKGAPDIIFTGFVSEGQLKWLYENCAAYVFPSLSEGFGLPGLEAMVHGAPVVSSNATCLPEVYGDAAHYFDPLDVDAMAKAINEVITDINLRQELIKKGQAQAAKYSWRKTAEQTLAIYKKVLGD